MPTFPKQLYVKWESQANGPRFLEVSEGQQALGNDGDKVAIYVLKEVKTKRVVESLV